MTPLMKLDFALTRLACRFLLLSWRYVMPVARTHQKRALSDLACVHPHAAGLAIGSQEIRVAVPPARDFEPVRVFSTFTADLHALATWLLACGIDTLAIESTGVFWIPIYELLEQHGIVPYLVNARHVKSVPGRKTDWNDAQWRKHAITGVSGLAMLRAIIAGERAPERLATFRQPGCKHSEAEIVKALTGTWDDTQIVILQLSVDLFDYYTTKITFL
jgi:transposase